MSTEIRYRFKKESEYYLQDENATRGYTLIHGNELPIKGVLKEFYNDISKPCIIHDIVMD
jgi:hypothetical protein